MAEWRLHCHHCGWSPPLDMLQVDVMQHQLNVHGTPRLHLDLIPHCSDDDAVFDLSESGDSGQCPTCGGFEILRVPKEFRS